MPEISAYGHRSPADSAAQQCAEAVLMIRPAAWQAKNVPFK